MRKSKAHWCPFRGFNPICGATPKELRIAIGPDNITCGNCIRICTQKIKAVMKRTNKAAG